MFRALTLIHTPAKVTPLTCRLNNFSVGKKGIGKGLCSWKWKSCGIHTLSIALSTKKMPQQTKIGMFFKKAETPSDSPVKKPELQIKPKKEKREDSEGEGDERGSSRAKKTLWKIGGGGAAEASAEAANGNGSGKNKRKSKNSPSDDEKPLKEKNKKQRRRILVESSSEDEGGEDKKSKMEVDEEDPKDKEPEKMEENEEEMEKVEDKKPKEDKKKKNDDKEGKKEDKKKTASKGKGVKKDDTSPDSKKAKKSESPSPKKENVEESPKKERKEPATPSPSKSAFGSNMMTMGGGANPKGWNADYDPGKTKYHPIDDASWKRGDRVPYLALAKTLEIIEGTSSRLRIIEILANYFRSVILLSPDDLLMSVYLCLNKLAPAYEGVELGVAETNVMKAIAQATGRSMDRIKSDAGTLGDLGLVAENSRSNQKTLFQPQPLTVAGVFSKLKDVASLSGQASHGKKISMITSMLVACKHSEARYLTRSLLGKLRIGLAEQSLLQALAQATFLTPPNQDRSIWPPKIIDAGKKSAEATKEKIEEQAYIIKSCFCECPNYDTLVKAMLEEGISKLSERCKLTPGVPPRPMLAQPTKGVSDVLDRFEGIRFTCEYKYDGERAQVHLLEDGSIRIFSRNQEDNTSKYPDIITRFSSCLKGDVKTCIIDAEAVAWDVENKRILPFQVLSTRKRKDAKEGEIKVQVCVFAFDLIYFNGESLVKKPLFERREILRENFQEVAGEFMFATSVDAQMTEEIQEFLEQSIKGNCEGLMVKTLDERASYELAKRSQKWLKLKKDYLESGGDSLDLVVIGGFLGKGKRTGTYGGFLLACYDPDEEAFQTICKIGTGFSDDDLQKHSEDLKSMVIPKAKPYYRFNTQLVPDHWFDAVRVWEVKCADLSLSPVHTAAEGMADPQRGISLRFPRFLRIRDDKNADDATSASQVCQMYKNQEQVKNSDKKNTKDGDDDEFY